MDSCLERERDNDAAGKGLSVGYGGFVGEGVVMIQRFGHHSLGEGKGQCGREASFDGVRSFRRRKSGDDSAVWSPLAQRENGAMWLRRVSRWGTVVSSVKEW